MSVNELPLSFIDSNNYKQKDQSIFPTVINITVCFQVINVYLIKREGERERERETVQHIFSSFIL